MTRISHTYREAADSKDHLAMMQHPEWWPLVTVLPLRNRTREPKPCGFADICLGYLKNGGGPYVILGMMFLPSSITEQYASFEDLIAAGWEVD